MSDGCVVGIDSSTQSTKVEVRRIADGEVVGTGRVGHPPTTPPLSEQDPLSWWEALAAAFTEIDPVVRSRIRSMSVAGQQHGLVLVGHDDNVLRPAKLWNDTESAPQAERLVAEEGARAWVERCGSVPGPSFTITKLAWVADNEPSLLDQTAKIMLPHDYLTWRLTGAHVTDRGDASGTGWWSPTVGDYADVLDTIALGLEDRLPKILGPTEAAGSIRPEMAKALGLAADVIIGPGTGDNMAGALGLGLAAGDLAISIGTSGTAYAVSRIPTADERGLVAGFADATGSFLPLVCTLNATKVTEAFRRLLGVGYDEFDQLALASPVGAGGVTLVPYLDGERTPNRPDASGTIVGLRSDLDRGQIARAAFEGVACGLLDGVEALDQAGVRLDGRTFLIGGGAQSVAYRRIVADLSGRDLTVPEDDETVAAGAAVQAAVVAGDGSFAEVAERWKLGHGSVIGSGEDLADVSGAVRQAYRQARDMGP